MCGRYRRTAAVEELARRYHIPIPPQRDLPISWNIAPSQDVLAIRYNPKTKQRRGQELALHAWIYDLEGGLTKDATGLSKHFDAYLEAGAPRSTPRSDFGRRGQPVLSSLSGK